MENFITEIYLDFKIGRKYKMSLCKKIYLSNAKSAIFSRKNRFINSAAFGVVVASKEENFTLCTPAS